MRRIRRLCAHRPAFRRTPPRLLATVTLNVENGAQLFDRLAPIRAERVQSASPDGSRGEEISFANSYQRLFRSEPARRSR